MVVRADASVETGPERLAYPRASEIGMVLGDANGVSCLTAMKRCDHVTTDIEIQEAIHE